MDLTQIVAFTVMGQLVALFGMTSIISGLFSDAAAQRHEPGQLFEVIQRTPRLARNRQKQLNEDIIKKSSNDSDVFDSSYAPWTAWSRCTRKCHQRRVRHCKEPKTCGLSVMKEKRTCGMERNNACKQTSKTVKKVMSKKLEKIVYDLLYYQWSDWSVCTRTCKRRRYRTCAMKRWCKNTLLVEEKRCYVIGTKCEKRHLLTNDQTEKPDLSNNNKEKGSNKVKKPTKPTKQVRPVKATTPDSTAIPTTQPVTHACGVRQVSTSLRIVGGYEARRGSWPWQIAVMTKRHEQYCGGVLIGRQWVLTAAHCVRKKGRRRRVIVRAGEHNLVVDEPSEQDFKIYTDYVHKSFDIDTIDSDIALLKLNSPVVESKYVRYACLPQEDDVLPINTLCYAIGWGKLKNTHIFGTDVLRQAPVPLVDDQTCRQAFDYEITNNQMCAGYRRGGVDTCAGDSGGPLMCEIEKNGIAQWYVYGVTSFGEGCGDRGKYGVYTKVNKFSNWIRNVTEGVSEY